jgi:hypothetical protein
VSTRIFRKPEFPDRLKIEYICRCLLGASDKNRFQTSWDVWLVVLEGTQAVRARVPGRVEAQMLRGLARQEAHLP